MRNMVKRPLFLSIDLEITNICHNICRICPRQAIKRPAGLMGVECFDALMNFLHGFNPILTLSGMGDPLLNEHWDYFIHLAKSRGYNIGLNVHPASLRSEEIQNRLMEAAPNRLYISFPGLARESFAYVNPTIGFDESVEIISRIAESAKGRFGIAVSAIKTGLDDSNVVQSFKAMWKDKGIRANIYDCHSRGGHLCDTGLVCTRSPGWHKRGSKTCSLFLFHTFVAWDGSILACCHDLDGQTALGHLNSLTPHQLLGLKKKLISGFMPYRLCKNCDEPLRYLQPAWGNELVSISSRKKLFKILKDNL